MKFVSAILAVAALLAVESDAKHIRGGMNGRFLKDTGTGKSDDGPALSGAQVAPSTSYAHPSEQEGVPLSATVNGRPTGTTNNASPNTNAPPALEQNIPFTPNQGSGSGSLNANVNSSPNTNMNNNMNTSPQGGPTTVVIPPHLLNGAVPLNIVEIATRTPALNFLPQLLGAAGLTSTLQGPGPFTVFAPLNTAFPTGIELLKLQTDPNLANILGYHVIPGVIVKSTDLSNGMMASTVQGGNVTIAINGTKVMVNDANVVRPDVFAGNGVIHVIDKMLVPPGVELSQTIGSGLTSGTAPIVTNPMTPGQITTPSNPAQMPEVTTPSNPAQMPEVTTPSNPAQMPEVTTPTDPAQMPEVTTPTDPAQMPEVMPPISEAQSAPVCPKYPCKRGFTGESGGLVCRGGSTTCSSTPLMNGDQCGCCLGDIDCIASLQLPKRCDDC